MREVVLPQGIVSFDGTVLELFGFGEQGSKRVHVGQITAISGGGSGLNVDVGPAGVGIQMMIGLGQPEAEALEALVREVDEVRGGVA